MDKAYITQGQSTIVYAKSAGYKYKNDSNTVYNM